MAAFRNDADASRAELYAHARSLGEALGRPVDAGEVAVELFRALAERFGVSLAAGDLFEEMGVMGDP